VGDGEKLLTYLKVLLVPTHALVSSYIKITLKTFIKNNPTCFDLSRSSSRILSFISSL